MNILRTIIVYSILVVFISLAFATGSKPSIPEPFQIPVQELEKAYQLPVDSLNQIWPGFALTTIPIGLYTNQDALLINHPSPDKSWDLVDTSTPNIKLYHRNSKPNEFLANTSIDYLGVPTTVFFISDSIPPQQFYDLLFHETFHSFTKRVRALKNRNGNAILQPFFPVTAEHLTLSYLEQCALLNAITSTNPQSQGDWVYRFLAIHSERQKILEKQFIDYEAEEQINEGIPTYAGMQGAILMGYPNQAKENLVSMLSAKTESATGFRDRCYGVGAALALLMDLRSPTWKTEISVKSDLISILRKTYGESKTINFEQIKSQLGYDSLYNAFLTNSGMKIQMYTRIETRLSQDSCWEFVFPSTSYIDGNQFLYDPMNLVATSSNHLCHGRLLHLVGKNGFQFNTDGKPILTEIEPYNFFLIHRIFTRSISSGEWIVDGKKTAELTGTVRFKEMTLTSPVLTITLRNGQYTCSGPRVVFQL